MLAKDVSATRSAFDYLCGPFFQTFRILGICPYTRNRSGVFQKKIASVAAAYTLCSGLAFGYVNYTVVSSLYSYPPMPGRVTNFNYALMGFGFVVFYTPNFVLPVVMWFETTKLQAYLQEWQDFQKNYDRVIGKSDVAANIGEKINLIVRSMFAVLFITGIALPLSSTVNDIPVLVCTMKSVSTMLFITGYWLVSTKVMEETNKSYQKKLQMDLNSPVFAHAIEDYRLLWVQMSKLIHDAGSYMSGTMTFCIFYTTIVVIYTIYILAVWGIIMIKLSFYKLLALTLAVLVCNGLSLYIYCDGGYSQTKKCVDNVILLILKMKTMMTWQNSNYIQITLFLNALNQYEPNVNVVGFYEINRGLFGSILSLLVTYLIVLIQLNSSFTTMPNTVHDNKTTNTSS